MATSSIGSGRSLASRSPRAVSPSSLTGLVEARQTAAQLTQLGDLVDGQLRHFGDLFVGGLTAELRAQVGLDLADLDLTLSYVDRDPDRPPVVLQAALDRLTDPERPVGGELEAAPPVELLDGTDQSEHPLLYEVLHRQPVALVPARLRNDQAQVRVDHPLLGLEVAALDPLGELDLLGGGQEWMRTSATEEQLKRVANPGTTVGAGCSPELRRVGMSAPPAVLPLV